MVGFLLLVVSNMCRIEPTQIVCLCCGLGKNIVTIGMDTIEQEAMHVHSLADNYNIVKIELVDKWHDGWNLEGEVGELKGTVGKLEEEVRVERGLKEMDKKCSGIRRNTTWATPVAKM